MSDECFLEWWLVSGITNDHKVVLQLRLQCCQLAVTCHFFCVREGSEVCLKMCALQAVKQYFFCLFMSSALKASRRRWAAASIMHQQYPADSLYQMSPIRVCTKQPRLEWYGLHSSWMLMICFISGSSQTRGERLSISQSKGGFKRNVSPHCQRGVIKPEADTLLKAFSAKLALMGIGCQLHNLVQLKSLSPFWTQRCATAYPHPGCTATIKCCPFRSENRYYPHLIPTSIVHPVC